MRYRATARAAGVEISERASAAEALAIVDAAGIPDWKKRAIKKAISEKPEQAVLAGPGTSAHKIFSELGLKPKAGCKCGERIRQMNSWSVQGCIENRETIISWWREAYHETTVLERARAGWAALSKPWFSASDPFGAIFDEAMRRAASDTSNATDQRSIGLE